MDLSGAREFYETRGIEESDLATDPITQFQHWYAEVSATGYWEPNAMVICTVDAEGRPAARNVLLKGVDLDGFLFFTNYTSDKAADLDRNGFAVLAFNWTEVRRQVIIRGSAERVSESESDRYWATRPRGSQIGAWASDQSTVVPGRAHLNDAYSAQTSRWSGSEILRPDHWGGYRISPNTVEFWQGRPNRLHDRLRYRRNEDDWVVERLAP